MRCGRTAGKGAVRARLFILQAADGAYRVVERTDLQRRLRLLGRGWEDSVSAAHGKDAWQGGVVCLLLLDPRNALLLRVDAQGVARGARRKDAVLDRELILWQPLAGPPRRLDLRSKELTQVEWRAQRDRLLSKVRLPSDNHHSVAEVEVERARVREKGSGKEAVADEVLACRVERLHVGSPPRALRA